MSKRLQVILTDDEYRAVARLARKRALPVAEVVRDSLRNTVAQAAEPAPEDRIADVLRFARFAGPTGEIDELLAQIEAGRGVP